MPEYRSLTLETNADFTREFRNLERRIERQEALKNAHVRAGEADKAGAAAERHAEAVDAQEDLLFNEMRRLWVNARQTDDRLPELPEVWEQEGSGRAIRFSFYEIEAYRGI